MSGYDPNRPLQNIIGKIPPVQRTAAGFGNRYRMIQDCHPDVELHLWTDKARRLFEVRCAECQKVVMQVEPDNVAWTVTGTRPL